MKKPKNYDVLKFLEPVDDSLSINELKQILTEEEFVEILNEEKEAE